MKSGIVIIMWIATFLVVFNSCSGEGDKKNKIKNEKIVTTEIKVQKELVTFLAEDSLTITADLYTHKGVKEAPFIILFHQAGYSRGEYIETVGKFIEMGYNCLAVDLRAGNEVNGIINETHKAAVAKGLSTEYVDAMPDMLAAIGYVKDNFEFEELLILGSSYSASLALIIAAQSLDMVDGVLAFSPGEYFKYDDTSIEEYASEILVPVFITSSRDERKKWKSIYEALPDDAKQKYIPENEGIHGSRALWKTTEGNQKYWKAVEKFIKKVE